MTVDFRTAIASGSVAASQVGTVREIRGGVGFVLCGVSTSMSAGRERRAVGPRRRF